MPAGGLHRHRLHQIGLGLEFFVKLAGKHLNSGSRRGLILVRRAGLPFFFVAQDSPKIPFLELGVIEPVVQVVSLHKQLNPPASILYMGKTGFTHNPP